MTFQGKTMASGTNPLKYVFGWLFLGTRGGPTRAKIIKMLKDTPQNANQIANSLNLDYRTVRHHLDVLQKNRLIVSTGDKYSVTYFLSPLMEANYKLFEEIVEKIWEKEKKE
ncbi:MAG: winged helix-turn-helix domain-containing protein [Nitrososphaeria archaeon]